MPYGGGTQQARLPCRPYRSAVTVPPVPPDPRHDPSPAAVTELEAQLRRVVDRLRSLSLDALRRPVPGHASAADAARAAAQVLADAAAALEGGREGDGEASPGAGKPDSPSGAGAATAARRAVPRLHDFAVADQVCVTGTDLLLAVASSERGAGWPPGAAAQVSAASQMLRELLALL